VRGQDKGLGSEEYQKRSAQVFLDKADIEKLGLKDGQKARVENDLGTVVVVANLSVDDAHPGLAFMVQSPWSNQIMGEDACQEGAPRAKISPTEDQVTGISEIFNRIVSQE
jgi:formylmethanofuran dehydrogenase subunit D